MAAPKGKLIPVGGSEAKEPGDNAATSDLREVEFFKSGILAEIVAEINGDNPRIEVIPAASGIPKEMGESYLKAFRELGCTNVHVLNINSYEEADTRQNLDRIEKADGVLFTGGDQTKLFDKLLDTTFLAKIHERYQNDNVVIAGTSAGAAAMPKLAIKEGRSGESLIKGIAGTEKGLSLLPNAIIDTHFMQRGRFTRLTEALLRNPGLLGIGLCTDSGVIITEGNVLRAIGSGSVCIIDTDDIQGTNYHEIQELQPVYVNNLRVTILAKGATYYLKDRIFTRTEETSLS